MAVYRRDGPPPPYALGVFTGLIQAVGRILTIEPRPSGLRLVVDPQGWDHRPSPGDSIAVNGCCLTVAEPPGPASASGDGSATGQLALAFDVVAETLSKTTLGSLRTGGRVNLEHAVRADTLMGGHFVQGHVDGVARVARVQADASDWRVALIPPAGLLDVIVPKGSVTLEGVSLTVAELIDGGFEVALIPTTLRLTTLGDLRVGDGVNIEADMLAKAVVHFLSRQRAGA